MSRRQVSTPFVLSSVSVYPLLPPPSRKLRPRGCVQVADAITSCVYNLTRLAGVATSGRRCLRPFSPTRTTLSGASSSMFSSPTTFKFAPGASTILVVLHRYLCHRLRHRSCGPPQRCRLSWSIPGPRKACPGPTLRPCRSSSPAARRRAGATS